MKKEAGARESGTSGLAGVVLAAGRSERMAGPSKLVRAFGRQTVIRRVVSSALAAGLEPVVVVVRQDDTAIRSALAGLDVRFVDVPGAPGGRLVSAIAGIRGVQDDPGTGAMILLGDEPGLPVEHIRTVRGACTSDGTVLRAAYRDRPGHPVLLPAAVLSTITELAGGGEPEASLWDLVQRSGIASSNVIIDSRAPIDIDTSDDLRRALEREAAG